MSEIILQQTQVKQGLPYYIKFTQVYPTVFDLANSTEKEVLNLWQGLGYYSRARNLHNTAKYVVSDLGGKFPNTYKELIKLKGVGDYTASAIASICFNEITAVVDGNVYRFLSRYFGISTPINSSAGKKEFKKIAQKLIDKENPADFNQAIMEFGATQCKPHNPICSTCVFKDSCFAFKTNRIYEFPIKAKPKSVKKRYFNYLVLISENKKTIINKRTQKGIWQNLYEFPLIETQRSINKGEDVIKNKVLKKYKTKYINLYNPKDIIHKLSHQHIYTKFWIVHVTQLKDKGILLSRLNDFPVSVLIANFLKDINLD